MGLGKRYVGESVSILYFDTVGYVKRARAGRPSRDSEGGTWGKYVFEISFYLMVGYGGVCYPT